MNKWIVLLTTAVQNVKFSKAEVAYRKSLYNFHIKQWLNKTNLSIFVVESTGYTFPELKHPRLTIISLNLNEQYLGSSSVAEAHSIMYILKQIKNDIRFQNCSHILKVTGRYFLENIENKLSNVTQNLDLYLQIHRNNDIKWQHTEYYGVRKELLYNMMDDVKLNLMEHSMYDFSKKYKYCTLGPFYNKVARGGDNMIIEYL